MSVEYEGKDPIELAKQAERDLNSNALKDGSGKQSDSSEILHYLRWIPCVTHTLQLLILASTSQ